MKRSYAITALVLAAVLALAGCRARGDGSAGQPGVSPTVTTKPLPTIAPAAAASKVAVDLSEVDAMLAELDRQLAEADKSPADSD